MIKLTVLGLALALALAQGQSCGWDNKNIEVKQIFGPGTKVELLFFFRKDISKETMDGFYENTVNRPHPGGGYWPRDGVQATFGVDRNGYTGFGFKFRDDATQAQRNELKRILSESPLVYRVYEDVVPAEIHDL